MWILTENNTMLNTDNITYMDIEETDTHVYIEAFFNTTSATIGCRFCKLNNTENNKNKVKRIFNEIFDSMYCGQETFNIPKRLGRV